MPKRQPSNEPLAVAGQIFGRSVQVAGLVAIYFGCSAFASLMESIDDWQQNSIELSSLCAQMLRVTIPMLLGIFMVLFAELNLRRARRVAKQLKENPRAPWLADASWQTATLKTSSKVSLQAFAIAWITIWLIGLPSAGMYLSEGVLQNIVVCLILFSISFTVTQWRWRKWTSAELRMGTMPGILGGPLTGVVRISRSFVPDTVFSASLQCTYLLPFDQSGESDNTRRVHWSSSVEIAKQLESAHGTTDIPVHFSIPFNCPESMILPEPAAPMRHVRWELIVHEKDQPARGKATFRVPVFKTSKSNSHYSPDPEVLEDFQPAYDACSILSKFQFVERPGVSDSTTMTFRLRDTSILKAVILMMVGCAAVITLFLLYVPSLTVSLFMSLIPAFILIAIIFNVVELCLWKGVIYRNGDQLTFDCGITRVHAPLQCMADESTKLTCRMNMQSQNQVLESWNLSVRTPDGTERLLMRQVGSQREVEAVQHWMAQRLGIGIEPISMESGFADLPRLSSKRPTTQAYAKPNASKRRKKN